MGFNPVNQANPVFLHNLEDNTVVLKCNSLQLGVYDRKGLSEFRDLINATLSRMEEGDETEMSSEELLDLLWRNFTGGPMVNVRMSDGRKYQCRVTNIHGNEEWPGVYEYTIFLEGVTPVGKHHHHFNGSLMIRSWRRLSIMKSEDEEYVKCLEYMLGNCG